MHILIFLSDLLRAAFWTVLLFAIDKPYLAVMTLLALVWHEAFHLLAFVREHTAGRLEPRLCGLRLIPQKTLSYEAERRIAAAGPIGGLLGAALCLLLSPLAREYFFEFALCHLFTSLSNLLPIEGYDGYRILAASAALRESEGTLRILRMLSFLLTGLLSLIFLSIFGVSGEGLFPAGAFLFTLFFMIDDENVQFSRIREKNRE